MIIVVDASVAAKWFIAEDNADEALMLLDRPFDLHAPDLLYLEIDNILCKLIRRGLLSEKRDLICVKKLDLSYSVLFITMTSARRLSR